MPVVLLVLSFIAVVAYEAPEMARRREWGELVLFLLLVLVGFVVSLLQAIRVAVPNPIKGIEFLTEKVARLVQWH